MRAWLCDDLIRGLIRISAAVFLWSTALLAQSSRTEQPQSVRRADSLFLASSWKAAAAVYRDVLAHDSSDARSWLRLATALNNTREWQEAAVAAERATSLTPILRPTALFQSAVALAKLNRKDEAVGALRRAIDAGYLTTATLRSDTSLAGLRDHPEFRGLILRLFGPYAFVDLTTPSPTLMAEGISHLVATVRENHPNPYRYWSPADWDTATAAAVSRTPRMTEQEYSVTLIRLAAAVRDVHTSAFPTPRSRVMQRSVPLLLWKFADGLYVRAADSTHRDLIGAKVVTIAGVSVSELWPRLIRDFSYENEWMAANSLGFLLQFPDFIKGLNLTSDSTAISYRLAYANGTEREITVQSIARPFAVASDDSRGLAVPATWIDGGATPAPLWLTRRYENYWLTELPGYRAVYMQFNLPRNDPLRPWPTFLDSLVRTIQRAQAERLIIDLRHNPGGYAPMANDLVARLREVPAVNKPGRLFALIGRVTQSAGVVIAAELERNAHAVFVGEPLGAHPNFYNGRQGNHLPQPLPGGSMQFRVSEVQEQYSHSLDPRRYIAPDIPAALTFAAFRAGRDPALEMAGTIAEPEARAFLSDWGGRSLDPIFRWQRPTQSVAWPDARRRLP